ncbi:putative necrosis-inducing factor-domain-containing protein [Apodospora peruviana]|uniref:Necrosis-inducing factor-domain-containing protein n=1 Tax=Apodospora peruviana TaxID=516989 RepID=A0AAE0HWZ5_9PEZI|nr:putative necrosis-inducing factor-domain-containing protein [Apodospora peruviana]
MAFSGIFTVHFLVLATILGPTLAVPGAVQLLSNDDDATAVIPTNDTILSTNVHNYFCKDYIFENQVSPASPIVPDCKGINRIIDKDGTWKFAADAQHQLVQLVSCAFGVEVMGPRSLDVVKIGNGDIIDIITQSIEQYQWQYGGNGKWYVGTRGTAKCTRVTDVMVKGEWADVEWGIYHN